MASQSGIVPRAPASMGELSANVLCAVLAFMVASNTPARLARKAERPHHNDAERIDSTWVERMDQVNYNPQQITFVDSSDVGAA